MQYLPVNIRKFWIITDVDLVFEAGSSQSRNRVFCEIEGLNRIPWPKNPVSRHRCVSPKKPGFWEIEDFWRIFWRKNPVSGHLLAAF